MTCKECIHYEVCSTPGLTCNQFKDKAKTIFLPCPIGSPIYVIVTKRPKADFPVFSFVKNSKLSYYNLERVLEEFGKTVFLTREEAEKVIKEAEDNA